MDNSHGREHTSQTAVQGRVPVNKSGEASPLRFVLSQEPEEMGRRHIHHVRGGARPREAGLVHPRGAHGFTPANGGQRGATERPPRAVGR